MGHAVSVLRARRYPDTVKIEVVMVVGIIYALAGFPSLDCLEALPVLAQE